ncbi:MAG: hypothetical protein M1820_005734 [Bogoriella megaspora]|nr:MAG: hypothetical protein M1820_005734 [Bogoriella megaspora]
MAVSAALAIKTQGKRVANVQIKRQTNDFEPPKCQFSAPDMQLQDGPHRIEFSVVLLPQVLHEINRDNGMVESRYATELVSTNVSKDTQDLKCLGMGGLSVQTYAASISDC